MNKQERIYAALEGQSVDQVPLTLWRHFHKQNQTSTGLTAATLAFYEKYNLDLIKLTPSNFYAIEDWGARISLSKNDDIPSHLKKPLIKTPADWPQLTTISITTGAYGRELEAIRLIASRLGKDDAPFLMTIYSPLSIAFKLAGDTLFEHIRDYPTEVHIGLATIAETTGRFADAALSAGADGIFFSSQLSRSDLLTEETYQTFVVSYDLIVLERVQLQPVPLILHLAGKNVYFETTNQYPAHAISWNPHQSNPSLLEALHLTDKTLMAGLDKTLLENGQSNEPVEQINNLIKVTSGKRLILSPTGAISPETPLENLDRITLINRTIA